jgi:hypothetical protein
MLEIRIIRGIMRLLITALFSLATLFAGSRQPPTVPPKQPAKTGTHNSVTGARSPGPTARPNQGTVHPATKGSPTKPVHVRQYTRKDGTVVRAHDRAAPGTASRSKGRLRPRKLRQVRRRDTALSDATISP